MFHTLKTEFSVLMISSGTLKDWNKENAKLKASFYFLVEMLKVI